MCVVLLALSLIDPSLGILVAKALYALAHDVGISVISDFCQNTPSSCFETHERTEQYHQDRMYFHP